MTTFETAIQKPALSDNGSQDPNREDGEPLGQKTNAIRWLQKKVMRKARELPTDFHSQVDWEMFRDRIRSELPATIGIPEFPPLRESLVRARIQVGAETICERVDIYVDEDYAIPAFVFLPSQLPASKCRVWFGIPVGQKTSGNPLTRPLPFGWQSRDSPS